MWLEKSKPPMVAWKDQCVVVGGFDSVLQMFVAYVDQDRLRRKRGVLEGKLRVVVRCVVA